MNDPLDPATTSSEAPSEPIAAAEPIAYPGDTLTAALARHGLSWPAERLALLDRYAQALWAWNEKINLTRHSDYERFVSRDLVDTVQLAALIHPEEEVLDIGSGGGVPGITLAILRPDLSVTLTDSVGKKAMVLQDLKKQLQLNVRVEAGRAEQLLVDERFDVTVARGVGSLAKMLTWLKDHWLGVGRLLAFKGPKWPNERGEARHYNLLRDLQLRVAASYPLAGTESEGVILKIWPRGAAEK